jgi:hypothetical protein
MSQYVPLSPFRPGRGNGTGKVTLPCVKPQASQSCEHSIVTRCIIISVHATIYTTNTTVLNPLAIICTPPDLWVRQGTVTLPQFVDARALYLLNRAKVERQLQRDRQNINTMTEINEQVISYSTSVLCF